MKLFNLAAAVLLLASIAQPSMAQVRVLELGHEADPAMITMPSFSGGELALQTCATCQVLRLRTSDETRYLLNKSEITLREMTQYLARNPGASVTVMQLKGTTSLSRVVVHGPAVSP